MSQAELRENDGKPRCTRSNTDSKKRKPTHAIPSEKTENLGQQRLCTRGEKTKCRGSKANSIASRRANDLAADEMSICVESKANDDRLTHCKPKMRKGRPVRQKL